LADHSINLVLFAQRLETGPSYSSAHSKTFPLPPYRGCQPSSMYCLRLFTISASSFTGIAFFPSFIFSYTMSIPLYLPTLLRDMQPLPQHRPDMIVSILSHKFLKLRFAHPWCPLFCLRYTVSEALRRPNSLLRPYYLQPSEVAMAFNEFGSAPCIFMPPVPKNSGKCSVSLNLPGKTPRGPAVPPLHPLSLTTKSHYRRL